MSNANVAMPVVVSNDAPSKKSHKKKANKHKSRNDFSDVHRIELDPSGGGVVTGPTTMDLLKTATDLNDLSQKLDERLTLTTTATNGGEPPNNKSNLEPEEEQSDSSPSDIQAPPPLPSCVVDATIPPPGDDVKIEYREYESELQMPDIIRLIQRDLSEPYSIYTYRYFIHNWPELCFLAMHGEQCVGAIVCKLGMHRQIMKRGYIAMLAVDKEYRKLKIGTNLVQKAIEAMLKEQADEVVLETEITNTPALRLYENLGFVRDKRLFHYYLNGVDALRLKLWFR